MASDIRLLEDLVGKAVERLKRLSRERDALQQEVETLRRKVAALEEGGADRGDAAAWQAERAQVAAALRETLNELRGD